MHTTIAFGQTGDVEVGIHNVAAVADPHKKTEGDYIYMDDWNKIIGYHANLSALSVLPRLMSPSLRRVNPYYITVFEQVAQPTYIVEEVFFPNLARAMVIGEGLEWENFVSAATVITCIVFLASVVPEPVKGNIHTVRFNTSPVRTASAWSFDEILLEDPLPVGSYDVVGARLEHDTGICFRLVPLGGIHRPGGMCVPATNPQIVEDVMYQRRGGLGVWCTFQHGMLPGLELICSAAAVKTTVYGYLDIIPR